MTEVKHQIAALRRRQGFVPMSDRVYEMIAAEMRAIEAIKEHDKQSIVELLRWLRGDGRMATQGHSSNLHAGELVNSYLQEQVFTCTVNRGRFQFVAAVGAPEEAVEVEAAKKVAARLIAHAIMRKQERDEAEADYLPPRSAAQ